MAAPCGQWFFGDSSLDVPVRGKAETLKLLRPRCHPCRLELGCAAEPEIRDVREVELVLPVNGADRIGEVNGLGTPVLLASLETPPAGHSGALAFAALAVATAGHGRFSTPEPAEAEGCCNWSMTSLAAAHRSAKDQTGPVQFTRELCTEYLMVTRLST